MQSQLPAEGLSQSSADLEACLWEMLPFGVKGINFRPILKSHTSFCSPVFPQKRNESFSSISKIIKEPNTLPP